MGFLILYGTFTGTITVPINSYNGSYDMGSSHTYRYANMNIVKTASNYTAGTHSVSTISKLNNGYSTTIYFNRYQIVLEICCGLNNSKMSGVTNVMCCRTSSYSGAVWFTTNFYQSETVSMSGTDEFTIYRKDFDRMVVTSKNNYAYMGYIGFNIVPK